MPTRSQYQRRNAEIVALRLGNMTLQALGDRYGLSRERVRGIIAIFQRKQKQRLVWERLAAEFKNQQAELRVQETQRPAKEPLDPSIVRGRKLARCFEVTLPLLEKAAKQAARDHQQVLVLQTRYDIDEDKAWTVMLLSRLHMRQTAKSVDHARAHDYERRHPWHPDEPATQAELQEMAKKLHWSEVIYRSGTDTIVALERRPWEV